MGRLGYFGRSTCGVEGVLACRSAAPESVRVRGAIVEENEFTLLLVLLGL